MPVTVTLIFERPFDNVFYVNQPKTFARPAAHRRDCGSLRAPKGVAQGTASLVALGYEFIDRKLYGIDGFERASEIVLVIEPQDDSIQG
jgi:hypothetical protein